MSDEPTYGVQPFSEQIASDSLSDRIAGLERLMESIGTQFDILQELASEVSRSCRIARGMAFVREHGIASAKTKSGSHGSSST
jgi:hypothetical protein